MKYREHDVEIPAFLEEWDDRSWRNDAMPKSEFEIAEGMSMQVWVNYSAEADREIAKNSAFIVNLIFDDEHGIGGQYDCNAINPFYQGNDETIVRMWVQAAELARKILADLEALDMPWKATNSFAELHDICDANLLGFPDDVDIDTLDLDVINSAQIIVDFYLRSHRE